MARTPDGPVKRTEATTVRHTKSWGAMLDRQRGKFSRSEWLRRLVQDYENRKED